MAHFTFIELHFEDGSFSTGDLFGGRGKTVGASDAPDEEPTSESESGGRGSIIAALVGLVFLVGVAYVARKKLTSSGEEEPLEMDEVPA